MKTIMAVVLTVIFIAAEADAQVYFQAPVEFSGTGCQPDSYTFSGNGTDTLSILFSSYDAANPPDEAASGLQRTACSFAVPIHLPQGYQVSAVTADWRGYAQGSTKLFREYFFAGKTKGETISNPVDDYTERDENMHFSSCRESAGEEMILRINSSVQAVDNDSYIVVDSVDMKNSLTLHVQVEQCPLQALDAVLKLLL